MSETRINDALYYTLRVGESPFSESLKIDINGLATFLSTGNFQPGVAPEIGFYALPLSEDVVADLWRTVSAVRFPDIDTSAAAPDEGEGTRVIHIVKDNRATAKMIGQRDAAPEGFKALEIKFRSVVDEVRKHPVSVLHMDVAYSTKEIQRGRMFQIVMTGSNPGNEPVSFANPLYVEQMRIGYLEIDGLRSDVPLLELRDDHHFCQKMYQKDMVDCRPEGCQDKPVIALSPGQTVTWTVQIPLHWPTGAYNVRLLYSCFRDRVGEEGVFEGGIESPFISINVVE